MRGEQDLSEFVPAQLMSLERKTAPPVEVSNFMNVKRKLLIKAVEPFRTESPEFIHIHIDDLIKISEAVFGHEVTDMAEREKKKALLSIVAEAKMLALIKMAEDCLPVDQVRAYCESCLKNALSKEGYV